MSDTLPVQVLSAIILIVMYSLDPADCVPNVTLFVPPVPVDNAPLRAPSSSATFPVSNALVISIHPVLNPSLVGGSFAKIDILLELDLSDAPPTREKSPTHRYSHGLQ